MLTTRPARAADETTFVIPPTNDLHGQKRPWTGWEGGACRKQSIENFTADDPARRVGGTIQASAPAFTYDRQAPRGQRARAQRREVGERCELARAWLIRRASVSAPPLDRIGKVSRDQAR